MSSVEENAPSPQRPGSVRAGCKRPPRAGVAGLERRFTAMGGACRLRVEGADEGLAERALAAAEAEIRRLERKYSRYLPESLTSRINRAAGGRAVAIDGETARLLHYADTLWRESGGRFDLTSGVLRRAWDFHACRAPDRERVAALLPLVDWQSVRWSEEEVSLPRAGMELDFGGCVKEYASDSAASVLRREGIGHGLVDLAGDLAVSGPRADGLPWSVGIRRPAPRPHAGSGRVVVPGPAREDAPLAHISLVAGGLASSGDYERCLEIDGRRYGHILDPTTGWPVQGLVAVSVAAEQCLVAGSAATIAMLKPTAAALAWLDGLGVPWLAVDADLNCFGTFANTPDGPGPAQGLLWN